MGRLFQSLRKINRVGHAPMSRVVPPCGETRARLLRFSLRNKVCQFMEGMIGVQAAALLRTGYLLKNCRPLSESGPSCRSCELALQKSHGTQVDGGVARKGPGHQRRVRQKGFRSFKYGSVSGLKVPCAPSRLRLPEAQRHGVGESGTNGVVRIVQFTGSLGAKTDELTGRDDGTPSLIKALFGFEDRARQGGCLSAPAAHPPASRFQFVQSGRECFVRLGKLQGCEISTPDPASAEISVCQAGDPLRAEEGEDQPGVLRWQDPPRTQDIDTTRRGCRQIGLLNEGSLGAPRYHLGQEEVAGLKVEALRYVVPPDVGFGIMLRDGAVTPDVLDPQQTYSTYGLRCTGARRGGRGSKTPGDSEDVSNGGAVTRGPLRCAGRLVIWLAAGARQVVPPDGSTMASS